MAQHPPLITFGNFIASLRAAKGISQVEFAELLTNNGRKSTQSLIAQIETGRISNPKEDLLRAMANILGVKYEQIIFQLVAEKYHFCLDEKNLQKPLATTLKLLEMATTNIRSIVNKNV